MIGIIYGLTVAIVFLAIAFVTVVIHYQGIISDLMDRLMARDFNEYSVGVHLKEQKKTPLKRWAVNDTKAATHEVAV